MIGKSKLPKVAVKFGVKQKMKLGAEIADRLPKHMSLAQVAKATGLSTTAIRNIECRALAKVFEKLAAIRRELREAAQ
jgi:DNA-directed RNA polymerase sigma subunit (sigma70/sigma32)